MTLEGPAVLYFIDPREWGYSKHGGCQHHEKRKPSWGTDDQGCQPDQDGPSYPVGQEALMPAGNERPVRARR